MWTSSCQKYGLANSARHGSTATTRPAAIAKPVGWFIHALTAMTMNEPVNPVTIHRHRS